MGGSALRRRGAPVIILSVLLGAGPALAQLRVVTWNITNYSGGSTGDIQTVVYGEFEGRSLAPDIILGQEFLSSSAVIAFRNALNSAPGSPGDWASAPYVNGADAALFYRTSKVQYLGYVIASQGGSSPNPPRHTIRYNVMPQGYTSNGAFLCCYNSHMKAGTAADDYARRLVEAERIRDNAEQLNPDWHFLLGADLNIRTYTEEAYQELTGWQPNNAGRFFDPVNSAGNWNDNATFRFLHSQDPVYAMDDRYDQILVSANLRDGSGFEYIGSAGAFSQSTWNDPNHSYRTWGNDGMSFNTSLRVQGNTMVGPAIAQAIINLAASGGHVPVYLDLRVPPELGAPDLIDFGAVPEGSSAVLLFSVWNDGDVARWTQSGISDLHYDMTTTDGFTTQTGIFSDAAGGDGNTHLLVMDTSAPGPMSGILTILSDAPDDPVREVVLVGEVLPAGLAGDLDCDGDVDFDDIDPFVRALEGQAAYEALYPDCRWLNGDLDGDGDVDFDDIDAFVELLS